jgi:membrane fusion protein (multidrug efflux system)
MSKPSRLLVFLSFAISITLTACGTEDSPPAAQPGAVTVVTLKQEPVALTRELPGRVHPFLIAEVRPQVNGIVKSKLFTEGSLVRAGAALYQLDDATYRANASSARAALERAQVTLKSAQLTAARSGELFKIDAISEQDNENAIAALRQAEADVGVARAALEGSDVTLGYARITAPITGRIGKSTVTQGALVTANQSTALATIQQVDPMYVDLTPSSAGLLQLRKELANGTMVATSDVPVTILLEDGTRYEHDGKTTFADLTVDPTTGSFTLRVVVPNPDDTLLPGTYVRAVISLGMRQNGILVPQRALARDPKGNTTAMVVGSDDVVEARAVQVSHTIGDKWLVEGGLVAGERVIIAGLQKVKPGTKVNATEATPEALVATPASK